MCMPDDRENFVKVKDQLRLLIRYSEVSRITRGFSFEEKYLLSGTDPVKYLARITVPADPEIIRAKRTEFEIIRRLKAYSSLVPEAHAFGISDDGTLCFMVLDYVEGTDGEDALCGLSDKEQYRIGVQAGEELRKMHAMAAPSGRLDWYTAIHEKYARKMAAFDRLGLDVPGIDREYLSSYIQKNLPCIRDAEMMFLHGDYHPSNLVLRDGDLKGIIDFNRYDWGDPVHDFIRVAYFTRAASVPFSVGQVNGYNGGPPTPEFWKRYSLYCAMTLLPDFLWAHMYEEKSGMAGEVERAQQRIRMVYSDHEGFRSEVPVWYRDFHPE